jgi:hypothetical protein
VFPIELSDTAATQTRRTTLLKLGITACCTAIVCFAISVATGLGASVRSGSVVTVAAGDSFTLSIGWQCQYGGVAPPRTALVCNPGVSGSSSQGEPLVSIQQSRVTLLGPTRPVLTTINTPKCCLRAWKFPAIRSGFTESQSDIDLAVGNSVSIPSLDLICRVLASDPDHHDPGHVFVCLRQSTGAVSTATMEASKYHIRVAEPGAKTWAYSVDRTP